MKKLQQPGCGKFHYKFALLPQRGMEQDLDLDLKTK